MINIYIINKMILRKLEINDYYLGINDLLSQLTKYIEISFNTFVKQYLKLGNNYNIYVIEENNKISRLWLFIY